MTATNNTISFENTQVAFAAKTDAELYRSYVLFASINSNWLVDKGTAFAQFALRVGLPIVPFLKHTLFKHFCGGESIDDCHKTIEQLNKYHVGTILDYSVEGEKTDESFDATEAETLRTIRAAAQNPTAIPFSVFKVTGLARFEILEKVSNLLTIKTLPALTADEEQEFGRVVRRVENLCQTAYRLNVRILIDAEETWIQDAIDDLAYKMMLQFNKEQPIVYNTYQMYRSDQLDRLQKAVVWAKENGIFLGVKLVRGAYMEKEAQRAAQEGYPNPIQPNKMACDRDYDQAVALCLENYRHVGSCIASHNEKSNSLALALLEKYQISPNDTKVFFAQLYGMSDHISYNLANAGYNVAKYLPYGPVKVVMPYLFRRAAENTSVAGQSSREFSLVNTELQRRRKTRK